MVDRAERPWHAEPGEFSGVYRVVSATGYIMAHVSDVDDGVARKRAVEIASGGELMQAAKEVWENRQEVWSNPPRTDPYTPLGSALLKLHKVIEQYEGSA